jgi:two-component system NarL family sensor kinase
MGPNESTLSDTEQLQQRNRELTILNHIAEALNRSIDLDQILNTTLNQVTELFNLNTGWVWLLRDEDGVNYLAAAQNLPTGLANNPSLMEGSCYCLDTYRAGDMNGAANVNVITCSRLKKLIEGTGGLRYHASIPLYAHGKKLGVFNVASAGWNRLSPEDLRILYTVGDLLSIAIERARLFEQSMEFGALEERNRLAREIHDTLAQGLAGITLQLETADALLETRTSSERVQAVVQQALSLARKNLEEARRSVLDLRASTLEGHTLPEALKLLAENISSRGGFRVKCSFRGASQALPSRIETGIYRIAQEALENVLRHAEARTARLELTLTPKQATLVISDDGRGFDLDQIPPGHFGLVGLNERVHLLGGRYSLQSTPGSGTVIRVQIPVTG